MDAKWWPYEFKVVSLADLIIERFDGTIGFQRPGAERFIQEGINDFRPRRFEPLILAKIKNGSKVKYSILDGGHREAMAEGTDKEYVPACVLREQLSYEERCIVFHDLNSVRRRLSTGDGMRARHQGREERIMALLDLLGQHGFYLSGYRPDMPNGERPLTAAGALNSAYKNNPAALDRALHVLEAWRDLHAKRVQAVTINALCAIAKHDDFDPDRLRGIFAGVGPEALMRDAREYAAKTQATLSQQVMKATILRHYNRNLRSRKIGPDDV